MASYLPEVSAERWFVFLGYYDISGVFTSKLTPYHDVGHIICRALQKHFCSCFCYIGLYQSSLGERCILDNGRRILLYQRPGSNSGMVS